MNTSLIKMFNKALTGNDYSYLDLVKASAAAGYIIHPDCATEDVMCFLKEETINPNSTFYKTWEDVVSKSREDLFVDQIKHYMSTYGCTKNSVDIDKSAVYTQNNDPIKIDYASYKYIMPATVDEIFNDCMKLLQSGIALNYSTINDIEDFITENNLIDKVDIDSIKNKEAKCIFAYRLDKVPSNEFDILRSIIYHYKNSAMLIKDSDTKFALLNKYHNYKDYNFSKLTEDNLKSLSKIFYRFKPLFLAIRKGNPASKSYINKIRRYAKKYHKPFQKGFWEDCLSDKGQAQQAIDGALDYAKRHLNEISNFKKVQLMQTIKSRLIDNSDEHIYVIRNGKQFLKKGKKAVVNKDYLTSLYDILKTSIVDSLKEKATTYNIPEYLHVALPTSEKNFVGNYPMGTNIDFSKSNNVVGIYWRNEWGTKDFDIHCYAYDNSSVGWNSSYYTKKKDIIYSGDMTYADPEAAELLFFNNLVQNCVIVVNKFNGEDKSKFKLFVATEDMNEKLSKLDYTRRYDSRDNDGHYDKIMVDPNSIKFEAFIDMNDVQQMNVGYIFNKKLYLMSIKSGYGRTAIFSEDLNRLMQNTNMVKANSYIDMEELLIEAGFKKSNVAELDFTNPSKDLIISLFS